MDGGLVACEAKLFDLFRGDKQVDHLPQAFLQRPF
jgi:hypothetical protein